MNRLKELRKGKKQTQKEFAQETGIPLRTLQSWENGESHIKPDKAQQLADYFGVSVGFLLGYSEDKNDFPLGFDSPEAFEKARADLIEELQNSYTKELALAYRGKELTGIIEKVVSRYDEEKEFLDQFFQLEEKDKSIIRYLVENLVKDKK